MLRMPFLGNPFEQRFLPRRIAANYPRVLRPKVRGVCLWYQAVQVARAAASCRYRFGHFCELVSGVDAVVAQRLPTGAEKRWRLVHSLRPLITPFQAEVLARLRKHGVTLVADYDDLLFAGAVIGLPATVTATPDARERLSGYARGLVSFDRFTVATRALRQQLLALAPDARVTVVPNGVSERWTNQGRLLYPRFRNGDALVIRYFAGSPSHDADFASVTEPLSRFLEAHPQVRLEVVGPLSFDPRRFPVGRAAAVSSLSYDELPRLLSSTWVNIAPLSSTPFNECKSALKLLEAGAFGCPTLASPSDDMLRHAELGAPVVLCRTQDDWSEALERMLDLRYRNELGAATARHVERHGYARFALEQWLEGLDAHG